MNKNPLVTIITATYNAEKFLKDSIASVLNQTYKNFEYIIIDGASKDGTIDILKQHDNQITQWLSEPDSGLYEAWNKGIARSKGEWILFIGADDKLLPNALEIYVNFINDHLEKDFDYISSKVERVNLDGSIQGVVGKLWDWDSFKKRMTTAHPGSFHSKQLFEQYGLYNTNYKIISDYEILLRPRSKLKAAFIDKKTVIMSNGGGFNEYDALVEVLKMFKNTGHLGKAHYYFHSIDLMLRFHIKKLLGVK
jgi:glycosyltransferase involved in cell wall biosynthesis